MAIRYLKIALVVFAGLQGWLYVAGNLANWSAGLGAVGYVLGMSGNEIYAARIFPAITNPVLVKLAFLMIIAAEFLVGALCMKGTWDLWAVRKESASSFNDSKACALLGTGMGMIVWFGGFIVIGGALFQMWQSEVGAGSFRDAFVFAVTSGMVFLIVSRPDQ